MDKSSDAFRTISEVAADLDLPQHVLRFWETRFAQIKPLKRGGGRRYYRPDDVDLLRGIRHLLYGEGYTIRGVQRILKEQGVRFVMTLWQEGAPGLEEVRRLDRGEPDADFPPDFGETDADFAADDGEGYPAPAAVSSAEPRLTRGRDRAQPQAEKQRGEGEAGFTVSLVPIADPPPRDAQAPRGWRAGEAAGETDGEETSLHALAQRFAPTGATGGTTVAQSVGQRTAPPVTARDIGEPAPRSAFSPLMDRLRPKEPRGEVDTGPTPTGQGGLSRDEVRRLQATLFELLECKRLLDQAR